MHETQNTLRALKCCIIIPTYNNEKTLEQVVDQVLEYAQDVLVINDGSTDQTASILSKFNDRIHLLEHVVNQGKGQALQTGFEAALAKGFDYAITIDSDGQHFPSDIPKFVSNMQEHPGAMLMGDRNMDQDSVPGKSSFGNKFSNFWFWVETGIKLNDTQTGFRMYPLKAVKDLKLSFGKFEFEIEVIVKLAWSGVAFHGVPVQVRYADDRVSHFRPFQDFTRISLLNVYLVTLTVLYYFPKRRLQQLKKKGLKTQLKEAWHNGNESNLKKSLAIGFGFFMGIVPIWGFQLLVGIPLSILFRLNKLLFIAAAHISIPPMIPLIIFCSFQLGSYFVEDPLPLFTMDIFQDLDSIYLHLKQYIIGSLILATGMGGIGTLASWAILTFFSRNKG